MTAHYDVLIVGAGHAGAQAAIALRQAKFEGSIGLVGDEPEPPYERPPLSKDYLAGERSFERLLLRPVGFWPDRRIDLLPGCEVVTVDPVAHRASLADGSSLGYGTLIWATGGAARQLTCAGHELAGVHTVRTRADVDRMMVELAGMTRAVVIGGRYIGLEAAAVLTKLGKQVTVIEAQGRVLARVAGEPLSRFYEAEHRAHGVDVRLGTVVACIEERDERVSGVRLADGELLACEMVIVGIGVIPATRPLNDAGAEGANGVDVDAICRTTLPDIYAIGDCAAHANPFADGARIRLESVQNANDMAVTAAKAILGQPQSYHAVPWFWSNQYDLKLQTVGLSTGHDEAIVRGDPAARSFSVVYRKAGRIVALDCVNAVKDYVQGRTLVIDHAVVDRKYLADISRPLKEMMRENS